jgi:hypothetical protein
MNRDCDPFRALAVYKERRFPNRRLSKKGDLEIAPP